MTTTGTIVVLNGSSCAGKTTLARAMQEILPVPYLRIGVDLVHAMLPERFRKWKDPSSENMVQRALNGMHRSAATLAEAGNNVIVDTVLVNNNSLLECAYSLINHRAFLVGVFCTEEELKRRADERGPDLADIALAQARHIHAHGHYDLKMNTTGKAPGVMAEQIKDMVNGKKDPAALRDLRTARITLNGRSE